MAQQVQTPAHSPTRPARGANRIAKKQTSVTARIQKAICSGNG